MQATALLKQDHEVIRKVLGALRAYVERREVPVAALREAITFSQVFVDRCHHGKEELCLFPCLEKRGIPREQGPIGVMLLEHETGRQLVRAIGESLARYEAGKANDEEVLSRVEAYVGLLEGHIQKENEILFAMGDHVMEEADDAATLSCYESKEAERLEPGTQARMEALAERLARLGAP